MNVDNDEREKPHSDGDTRRIYELRASSAQPNYGCGPLFSAHDLAILTQITRTQVLAL